MKVVIELVNAFLHVYIFSLLFNQFWKKRVKLFLYWIVIVLLTAALTTAMVLFKENPLMYVVIFVITFALSLMYESKFVSKLIFSLIFLAIGAIGEVATAIIINTIFSVNFTEGKQGAPYITGMLISKFVLVFVIIIIKTRKHLPLLKQFQKNYFSIFLFPVSTLLIGIAQHHLFVKNPDQSNGTMYFILICYTLLILANLIVFDFIDSIYNNTFNEGKVIAANEIIATQTAQYKELIDHNKNIAKIQHENKHLFYGILSELEAGNTEAAIKALRDACEINEKDIISGENIIYTIIRMKKEYANSLGIDIDYKVRNMSDIHIEATDMAIILGNALDNAIEGARGVFGDIPTIIELFVTMKNNMIFISVKNPVLKDINVDTLSSSKADKNLHGFGIINMKSIADKYEGEVNFKCQDKIFETSVYLKDN